jgi:glycerol-3-phosphate acyltransferase PlsY
MTIVLSAVIAYVLGSLNFSIILSKFIFRQDVREGGSGNAGATNMARRFGKAAGLLTLVGDMLKAAAALYLGHLLGGELGMAVAGPFCQLGHCFPAFYRFKGGKGVSVGLTIAFAACWQTGVFALAAFGITVLISKKVSLGSLMGCVGGLIAVFLFAPNPLRIWMTLIAALIIVARHSANIRRLAEGKESNFHFADEKEKEADQSDKSI